LSAGAEVVWCLGRQVLPTQLIPDEKEGKVLRVRFIQKEGVNFFKPTFLFDEGSTISWIPCGRKLTCSFPGIKFFYGPDTYYGEEVRADPRQKASA
jgi:phosphoribulokinase